jgi:DNA-binding XRE family transcriptional regulator
MSIGRPALFPTPPFPQWYPVLVPTDNWTDYQYAARRQRGDVDMRMSWYYTLRMSTDLHEYTRLRRAAQGLTLQQAATLAGVSASYWCDIEKGRRTITLPMVKRMAPALGVDRNTLYSVVIRANLASLGEDLEAVIRPSLGF